MKKLLSVLLILCMLGAGFVLLTSCGGKGISEKELQKNTDEVLTKAYQNTTADFFNDGSDAGKVMEQVFQKGSINLTVATDLLTEGTVSRLNETIYIDSKAQAFASDTQLSIAGVNAGIMLFGNRDSIALKAPALLGDETTYAFNPKTFTEKLKGSTLAKMMEMTDEDVAEVIEYMNQLLANLDKKPGESEKELNQLMTDIYALMNQTITTEEVEVEADKTVSYLVVSYTLNNESMKGIFDKFIDYLGASGSMEAADLQEYEDMFTEAMGEIDLTVDLSSKIYLDPKTAKLVKISITGNIAVAEVYDEEPMEMGIDATMSFSDTEIALKVKIDTEEETVQTIRANLTLKKEATEDATTYALTANAGASGVTVDLGTITYTYNKSTGDISIVGKLGQAFAGAFGDMTDLSLTVNANSKVSKDEYTFKIKDVRVAGVTYTFEGENELSFTAKALKEIPTMPADTKDIMDLTESDWTKLGESIMSTELFELLDELIGGMGGSDIPGVEYYEIDDELLIGVGSEYTEAELDGYAAAYETDEAAILVLRESKEDCKSVGINSLDDYLAAVLKNSGIPESDVQEHFYLSYFEYESSDYGYLATVYETEDAYWLINYAASEDSYEDEYRDTFLVYLECLGALDMD